MCGGVRVLIGCLTTLVVAPVGAEDKFPYDAHVSVDQMEVRCGPSWDYYAIGLLKRGEKVAVYRHAPGGWLAIRPPKDSFSWVAERHLTMSAERGVAKVNRDSVVAWVGSSVSNVGQHKWQVRLERGELVEVLGKQALSVGPGFAKETYYKIAPPAGEFRWIHAQQSHAKGSSGHRVASSTIQLTDFQPPASTSRAPRTEWSSKSPSGNEGDLSSKVERWTSDLGLAVSHPIGQWDLDSLRQRLERLKHEGRDPPWPTKLRELSLRMGEFDALNKRYQRMLERDFRDPGEQQDGPRAAPRLLNQSPRLLNQSMHTELFSTAPDEPVGTGVDQVAAYEVGNQFSFDAEGWLVPVHSTKRIAPPFAVLDDDGRVRCYVSPSPGLNLRRYQRRHVGLYGHRRYVKSLRAPHITVERVVRQDRQRNRDD